MIDPSSLQALGLVGLYIATLLSSTFLPSIGIPLIIYLIYQDYNLGNIIIIATLGNWTGAIVSYYLGYYCKWEWIEKYLRIKESKLNKAKYYIDKYHAMSALFTGLPVIGDRITLALGVFRTSKLKTFIYMFIGKALRYCILVAIISLGIYGGK